MDPDAAWIIGTAIGALITTGPAYIAAKRSDRKIGKAESTAHAENEHAQTRQIVVDALNSVVGPLNGRLDEMHATLADIHEWQADHGLQHASEALKRIPALEIRKGS